MHLTRREILQWGAAAGATLPFAGCAAPPPTPIPADRPVRLGFVGLRGRGNDLLGAFRRVRGAAVTALCDVDPAILQQRREQAEKLGERPRTFVDAQELFAQPEIDAVVIAAPNHLHAVLASRAMAAGKHVYLEKPVSHDIDEGNRLLAVQRRTGRIVAAGTQNRSDVALRAAFADLHRGRFGAIRGIHGLCLRDRAGIGKRSEPLAPPPGLAYDLWLGPAPDAPIFRPQFHYDWHWSYGTGNGEFGNQTPHELDMICWALGDPGLPEVAFALGGRFGWDDAGETANVMAAWFRFPGGIPVAFELRNLPPKRRERSAWHGLEEPAIVVDCDDGELRARRGGAAFLGRDDTLVQQWQGDSGAGHQANFIAALRSGREADLVAPLRVSVPSAALAHLGNASLRLGVPGDAAAARAASADRALLAEHTDRLCTLLQDHGTDYARTPLAIGPQLDVDRTTGLVIGAHAEAANALLHRTARPGWQV